MQPFNKAYEAVQLNRHGSLSEASIVSASSEGFGETAWMHRLA